MEKCDMCGYAPKCCKYTKEARDECRNNGYDHFISVQELEIKTIKPREFHIRLSDADVERIYHVAGSHGLTPEELLEQFIGDLVCGTHTNGSDERDLAYGWMERCWFGMFPEETFLRYLIEQMEIDYFLDDLDSLEDARRDQAYCQSEEYKEDESDEDERKRETGVVQGVVRDREGIIKEYYEGYLEDSANRDGSYAAPEPFEDAVKRVKEWNDCLKKMLGK